MTGESIDKEELMSLFEAARWAPSSYNGQPWRFVYAMRGTTQFETCFKLLTPGNQESCKDAAVLVVTASRDTFEYNSKPERTHTFDTGAAWENIALQAAARELVVHAMEGFDYDKAAKVCKIPKGHTIEMMFAVGKRGSKDRLPERVREWEAPNARKKVEEFAFEGVFKETKKK